MAQKGISFSNVDAAWLQMEDPTNLMMVTGVMILDAPVDFERLKQLAAARLLAFDRFTQRVVQSALPLRNPRWEPDPNFNLDAHMHRLALPEPGDQETLQALISDLMSMPLDFSKPLWQFHLVENVGSGCALVSRIHHCVGDGTALVRVLLSLLDTEPDAPLLPLPPSSRRRARRHLLSRFLQPTEAVVNAGMKVADTLLHESMETLLYPTHAADLARIATKGASALGKLLLMPPDPPTPFKGRLGVQKRAAWSAPIPLADVKAVGRAFGATVNDVLLTAMTGALRRYLIRRGTNVEELNIRAVVPVDLRPKGHEHELGNQFGLVFLALPMGIADPRARLLELRRRMNAIKESPEAVIAFGILNMIGMSPKEIVDQVVTIFAAKATAVMTNVPGPQRPLYVAGRRLENVVFWVPQSGRLGLGVSIMSYNGQVTLGVATDAGLVPDPDGIIAGFHEEFDALVEIVRQGEMAGARVVRRTDIASLLAELDAIEARIEALAAARATRRAATAALGAPLTPAAAPAAPTCSAGNGLNREEGAERPRELSALADATPAAGEVPAALTLAAAPATEMLRAEEPDALVPADRVEGGEAAPEESGLAAPHIVRLPEPGRCHAMTKAGQQCRNSSLSGSAYCRVHQP